MKLLQKTALALALAGAVGSVWAGWDTWTYRGEYVTDGGTQVRGATQAWNTWDDWAWRGIWDGNSKVYYCYPSPGTIDCNHQWNTSKTTSYSHTTGWSVGGGFGYGGAEATGTFQQQKTWTQQHSEDFNFSTRLNGGYFAQPVIVAVRRWKQGHFHGAHFLTYPVFGYYHYEWQWKNFGSWSGSEREWGYKMIQITNNRGALWG